MSQLSGWHSCFVFGRSWFRVSYRRPAVIGKKFRGFPRQLWIWNGLTKLNNFMEMIPSWEAAGFKATQELQNFMEFEVSLPCSKEPYTGPYFESDQSSPYHPILSLQDPF
jgi:hypothetical protein